VFNFNEPEQNDLRKSVNDADSQAREIIGNYKGMIGSLHMNKGLQPFKKQEHYRLNTESDAIAHNTY
jgi:hypothetical protein